MKKRIFLALSFLFLLVAGGTFIEHTVGESFKLELNEIKADNPEPQSFQDEYYMHFTCSYCGHYHHWSNNQGLPEDWGAPCEGEYCEMWLTTWVGTWTSLEHTSQNYWIHSFSGEAY